LRAPFAEPPSGGFRVSGPAIGRITLSAADQTFNFLGVEAVPAQVGEAHGTQLPFLHEFMDAPGPNSEYPGDLFGAKEPWGSDRFH
jgi:hypothetical protein